MLSLRDLSTLPEPAAMRHSMRCSAILSVVLSEEPYYRCFHFDPLWGADGDDVAFAKFDNGSGDHVFVLFTVRDAVIKGFDHESPVSQHASDAMQVWRGMYDGLPPHLATLLADPCMMDDDVTFCVWWQGGAWRHGPVEYPGGEDDGSSYLLPVTARDAAGFHACATDYYESPPELELVEKAFAGTPLTAEWVKRLNPERDVEAALAEIARM